MAFCVVVVEISFFSLFLDVCEEARAQTRPGDLGYLTIAMATHSSRNPWTLESQYISFLTKRRLKHDKHNDPNSKGPYYLRVGPIQQSEETYL